MTSSGNSWMRTSEGQGLWEHRGKVALVGWGQSHIERRWRLGFKVRIPAAREPWAVAAQPRGDEGGADVPAVSVAGADFTVIGSLAAQTAGDSLAGDKLRYKPLRLISAWLVELGGVDALKSDSGLPSDNDGVAIPDMRHAV